MSKSTAFAIACLALFATLVNAAETVPSGKLYSGGPLSVRAPNSEGWSLMESSETSMSFARRGDASYESYAAQVWLFHLPDTSNEGEFLALIKQRIKKGTPPKRFTIVEEHFEYTNQRGYPCVLADFVVEDKKAKTSLFGRRQLTLQTYSLFCRHPKLQKVGFVATFSYRGHQVKTSLAEKAKDFIGGVQVPSN